MALAECCLASGLGATIETELSETELFGERPGGFIVSGPAEEIPGRIVGTVGGERLRIAAAIDVPLDRLREAHSALAALFD